MLCVPPTTHRHGGAGASGVWGSRARWNPKSSGTVSDEDLQAQAWLPSCLRALLAEVRSLTLLSYPLPASFQPQGTARARLPLLAGLMPVLTVSMQCWHLAGPWSEVKGACRLRRRQMRC